MARYGHRVLWVLFLSGVFDPMRFDHTIQDLEEVRRVYSLWGRHPRLYAAQDWITFMGRHRRIREGAVEAAAIQPNARVLEVACGTGRNFPYIEDRIGPGGQLVGFDYSHEMLAAARDFGMRRGWSNIEFVQGDAAVLDVGSQPFDAVVSVLGISAVPDHLAALRRCRDILRSGGVLAVCDARLFSGALAVFNPLVRAIYGRGAARRGIRIAIFPGICAASLATSP